MATLAGLVDRTYEILFGVAQVERPAEDTVDGAVTSGATSMTPDTPAMWKRGDYAEFPDGEVVIFAADSAGATTIRRAQRGTTAAAHSDADVILKNPWPLRVTIEQMINDVVRTDLWPHVWSWHQDTVSFTTGDTTYALDQYVDDVVMVYQANLDSDGKWHPLPVNRWDVERQINSAVATNGGLLRLRSPVDADATVYYTAKRRPHPDDLSNLDAQLEPMVAWAAAAKCFVTAAGATTADRARSQRRDPRDAQSMYQLLMGEFLRLRGDYARQLEGEVRRDMRWRPLMRRRW